MSKNFDQLIKSENDEGVILVKGRG